MKHKNIKTIPRFRSEDEERAFWDQNSMTDYIAQFEQVDMDFSQLKPTTESISLRLPAYLLQRIKELANAKDVPYQSLMKVYLSERIEQELAKSRTK